MGTLTGISAVSIIITGAAVGAVIIAFLSASRGDMESHFMEIKFLQMDHPLLSC